MSTRLLLVEPDPPAGHTGLEGLLSLETSLSCHRVAWKSFDPQTLQTAAADLLVAVDVPQTREALGLFDWLRDHSIDMPAFAVLPADAEENLLRIASETLDDFIVAPLRISELRHRIGRLVDFKRGEARVARRHLIEEIALKQLVGNDPSFLRTLARIPLVARSGAPVLITGETGTGKELCARAVHHLSLRRNYPFIAVNCSALPDHLFENELFGHARGAYTDAHSEQKGLAAMADRGTLFLDEIDSLSTAVQAKLLRFLQEKTYKPLGADRFFHVDVNVIAATSRDLESCVREGTFRSDIYFRLNVLHLHLPPLRDRREDLELLARHFLLSFCPPHGAVHKTLSPNALRKLVLHRWPGNIRELANVLQRAVVFSEGSQILPCHISFSGSAATPENAEGTFREAKGRAIQAFERHYVEELLRKHGGNITRAAREARKDRRVFGRLVKKHGIDREAV
jgi:two-component system response regulator GlrR